MILTINNYVENREEEERACKGLGKSLKQEEQEQGGERAEVVQAKREGRKITGRRIKQVEGEDTCEYRIYWVCRLRPGCTIQSLRMGRTHMVWGNLGASKTAVGGMKNGNANAIAHKATDHWVGFVSFFSIGESPLTNHSISFMAKDPISRHEDEGSEMALLS